MYNTFYKNKYLYILITLILDCLKQTMLTVSPQRHVLSKYFKT